MLDEFMIEFNSFLAQQSLGKTRNRSPRTSNIEVITNHYFIPVKWNKMF